MLWEFGWNVIPAVEGRGKNYESDARLRRGIHIIVDDTARNVNDIARRQFNAFLRHHEIAVAANQHDRAIVSLMQMWRFTIANLHDVMARAGPLAEGRDLDIFTGAQRICRHDFGQVELF